MNWIHSPLLLTLFLFIASFGAIYICIHLSKEALKTYQEHFQTEADAKLGELFLFINPAKLFALNLGALIVIPLFLYLVTGSLFYTLAALIIMAVLPRYIYRYLHKKRILEFEASLPDALAQIGSSVRAGTTLPNAMEQMVNETKGPISDEFALTLKEYRMGVNLEQTLDNMNERVPNESLRMVIVAANIAREVGGNLSEIFERLGETLRQKHVMEGKIVALTSQGKMQGWVVGFLPIGMIFILKQTEPVSMGHLTSGLLGWGFLGLIGVLECLGMYMIMKIVDIDV